MYHVGIRSYLSIKQITTMQIHNNRAIKPCKTIYKHAFFKYLTNHNLKYSNKTKLETTLNCIS